MQIIQALYYKPKTSKHKVIKQLSIYIYINIQGAKGYCNLSCAAVRIVVTTLTAAYLIHRSKQGASRLLLMS